MNARDPVREYSHYLAALFEPRSVALIGASDRPEKVGGRLLENLLAAKFDGAIHAVNPRHDSVQGLRCLRDASELPEGIDLAVIATPAASVPGVVEACGRRGIRAAVVITAGFRETGRAGAALEAELISAARRHGVRLLGPNCVGLMRPPIGLNATFARGQALAGGIALVSQSGAVCTAMLDWATPMGVGFSSVISLGGSSDLDFGEIIDYLAADPATRQIMLYIEGVRDGRRFMGSLRAAARAKPVIVMKVGRHPSGSRAAVSHTGAIVGRDDVFDAVVRRAGVVRVQSAGELVAAALALASNIRPAGDRLAIITNGGGPGVMAADRAADLDIPLATLDPDTIARLQAVLPANWSHANPVDLIGDAGPERYRAAVAACLADRGVDGVLAVLTPQAMTDADAAAEAVIEAAHGSPKPLIACWMGEASVERARETLRDAHLPVLRLPENGVEAFAYLASFYRNQRLLLEAPPPLQHLDPSNLDAARALVRAALDEGRSVMGTIESKDLLEAFGIRVARAVRAANAGEAARAARTVGFPVVLKIDSPDISHKSDVGGVRLGLADAQAVRDAFAQMIDGVSKMRPGARIIGVSVERMLGGPHARELMAGIVRDPVFGPAIVFGAGGIAVEVLRDRAVALPPLNAALVAEMERGTRVFRMLGDFRNLPAVDRAALEAVLLRVSEMACEMPEIEELDINPLIADEHGVVALDARVVLTPVPPGTKRYAHLAIPPYPAELVKAEQLRDGRRVLVRPIRPEDAAIEAAFVAALSDQSRHMRFQGGVRSLTPGMLARFTQIDYDREMALIAVASDGGTERQVAVGRYVTLPDGTTCEYAIVVGDEWQSSGLGRLLMGALIAIARDRGLDTMMGLVLAENTAMLSLCAELGFRSSPEPGTPALRRVELDLRA